MPHKSFLLKESLIKSDFPAAPGCAAKINYDKLLILWAKNKSHFFFAYSEKFRANLFRASLKFCTAGVLSLCIVGSAYGQTPDLPNSPVCDRTPQVRTAIVNSASASLSGIHCSEITISQLATLTAITLIRTGVTELRTGDFAGLTHSNLAITLGGNHLQTLPDDIFAGISPALIDLQDNPFGEGLPLALIGYFKAFSNNLRVDLVTVQDVLSTTTLAVGTPMDVDLEDAFFYASGTNVRNPADGYEITVADNSVATAAVSGHTLTLTPAGEGQTTIDIAGVRSSNGQRATQTLTVQAAYPEPDPVCMRTQQVRTIIVLRAVVDNCSDVGGSHLAAITQMPLQNQDITALQSGDFAGLTHSGLQLFLSPNKLQTLPADIFAGISPSYIDLRDNPFGKGLPSALVDDFKTFSNTLYVDLAAVQDVLSTTTLAVGTPMDVDLEDAFFYANGVGASERSPADSYEITVDNAAATATVNGHIMKITATSAGQTDIDIVGVQTSNEHKATQTLTVQAAYPEPDPPVCMRTRQVRNVIVGEIDEVSDCTDVTGAQLAAITELNLSDQDTAALQSGDFNGLAGLTELDLSNNDLQTLPAGIFGQISETITSINLQGNPFGKGLPLALVAYFKTFSNNLRVDLVFVQDTLPASLKLTVGNTMELELEDAFFHADGVGASERSPADSYEITVDNAAATATVNGHLLKITATSAGQTDIDIIGVQTSNEHKATQTLTVEVPAESLKFRIKVFLEGAQ